MKKVFKKLSAFALLLCLSMTAWAQDTPATLGTVAEMPLGECYIYYQDGSGVNHFLYAKGTNNWATSLEPQKIVLTKGVTGVADKAYFMNSNGFRMSNTSNGDGTGVIKTEPATRDDRNWDSQVYYELDGKYAIRITNANSTSWGANQFCSVSSDGLTVSPTSEEGGADLFVWNVYSWADAAKAIADAQETYDNTIPQLYTKDAKLITSTDQLSSNAPCPSEGPITNLIDGDNTTYFHSDYTGKYPKAWTAEDGVLHDLYVTGLSADIKRYKLKLEDRAGGNNGHISKIEVYGGELTEKDGAFGVFNITSGASPLTNITITGSRPGAHEAEFTLPTGYDALAFRVAETVNNSLGVANAGYFHVSEFQLFEMAYGTPKYDLADATVAETLKSAIDALQASLDDWKPATDLTALLAAVKDAEAAVKSGAQVEYNVSISGLPAGITAKATIGGVEYADGAAFKHAPIEKSAVTATELGHYSYEVTVTGDQIKVVYTGETLTDLDVLANAYTFRVICPRGYWYTKDDTEVIEVRNGVESTLEQQSFAVLKSDKGNYYLYSMGKAKFVKKSNDQAGFTPVITEPVTILTDGQSGYPFRFKLGDKTFNNNNSGKLVVNDYSSVDAGNSNKLVFVKEVDFTALLADINEAEKGYKVTFINAPALGGAPVLTYKSATYGNEDIIETLDPIAREEFTITHYPGYADEAEVSGHSIVVTYTQLPFMITTDDANPYYYFIQSGRTANTYLFTYSDGKIALSTTEDWDNQRWYFKSERDGEDLYFYMIPAAAPDKMMGYNDNTAGAAKIVAVGPSEPGYETKWVFVNQNGNYGFSPFDDPSIYFSNYGGAGNLMGFWTNGPQGDQGSKFIFIPEQVAAFAILEKAIDTAEKLVFTVGTEWGQTTAASAAAFNTMLANVKTITVMAGTDAILAGIYALKQAYEGLDYVLPGEGDVFTMNCTERGAASYAYATEEGKVFWNDGLADTHPGYLWTLEVVNAAKRTYNLKNILTGTYVGAVNLSETLELTAEEEEKGVITVAVGNGKFAFISDKGDYASAGYSSLHAATSDKAVVGWEPTAGASRWTLDQVEVSESAMSITEVQYGTFIAPFDVIVPEGVTAYADIQLDGNDIDLDIATDYQEGEILPANTPVIVGADAATDATFKGAATGADNVTAGLLTGVFSDQLVPVDSYILMKHNDEAAFGHVSAGKQPTVTAGHCFLTKAVADAAYLRIGGKTTNIANTEAENDVKVVYDLTGRRVEAPAKGIYVINGKKVLVK